MDETSGIGVNSPSVDKLTAWIEKDYITAIVVRNIFDITNDLDDLRKFICKAEGLNVSIYSLECGMNLAYVPWDGSSVVRSQKSILKKI